MRCIHIPEFDSYAVNSAFNPVDVSTYMINPPQFSGGKVSHYYHKSYEEFGIKRDRGEGSSAGGRTGKDVETFFIWDVDPTAETFSPVPELLRQRSQVELQNLLSTSQVADVHSEIEEKYRGLSLSINGVEFTSKYEILKKEFRPNNWHKDFRTDGSSSE